MLEGASDPSDRGRHQGGPAIEVCLDILRNDLKGNKREAGRKGRELKVEGKTKASIKSIQFKD